MERAVKGPSLGASHIPFALRQIVTACLRDLPVIRERRQRRASVRTGEVGVAVCDIVPPHVPRHDRGPDIGSQYRPAIYLAVPGRSPESSCQSQQTHSTVGNDLPRRILASSGPDASYIRLRRTRNQRVRLHNTVASPGENWCSAPSTYPPPDSPV